MHPVLVHPAQDGPLGPPCVALVSSSCLARFQLPPLQVCFSISALYTLLCIFFLSYLYAINPFFPLKEIKENPSKERTSSFQSFPSKGRLSRR
jgi:hypothetical protein